MSDPRRTPMGRAMREGLNRLEQQGDLFTLVPTLPRAEGDRQAAACARKAERVTAFDANGARSTLLMLLNASGPTSGEKLVELMKKAGFRPHDDRAFGAVFGVLAREGRIRCVGHCNRKRGHGTGGGRIWSLAS